MIRLDKVLVFIVDFITAVVPLVVKLINSGKEDKEDEKK